VELAFALERFVVGGGSGEAYVDTIGSDSPRELVLEIENQLRALLRDVLCGFLDADLKSAADDILLRSAEPFEIEARDTRRFAPPTAERRPPTAESQPAPRYWPQSSAVAQAEPEAPPAPATTPAAPEEELDDGVTPSADWGFDDDPESFSAPV
jgi:hypothetical protein